MASAQEPQLRWPEKLAGEPAALLGYKAIQSLVPLDLTPPRLVLERPSFEEWLGDWGKSVQLTTALPRTDAIERPSPEASFLPPLPVKLTKAADDTAGGPDGILRQYGDLGMRVVGRGEMGGSWNRYSPCDPSLQITCKPSLFPQLKPDVRFGVLLGGTISDRVHVSVDYDQSREFDATNNINVYYQGMADEVLQRVEVGDVSIQLPTSRYLTQGIPAGNFGFKAIGQLGPIEFQSVFAQQRGDVTTRDFRLGGLGAGQTLEQEAQRVLDDADYAEGQFFFLIDPDSLSGAPDIDVLSLRATDAPARLRPAGSGGAKIGRASCRERV